MYLVEKHISLRPKKTQGQWYGDGVVPRDGPWNFDANGRTTAFTKEDFDNVGTAKYSSYFDTTNGYYDSVRTSDLKATG